MVVRSGCREKLEGHKRKKQIKYMGSIQQITHYSNTQSHIWTYSVFKNITKKIKSKISDTKQVKIEL